MYIIFKFLETWNEAYAWQGSYTPLEILENPGILKS